MIRAVFVLLIFIATFAKSQNCQSSCRVVCDEREPRHLSLLPGKRGQKGEKGERGRDGPQGTSSPSNAGLVKSIEERVVRLESVLENLPTKYKTTVCGSGIQDRSVVNDNQIKAPSYWSNSESFSPKNARLFGSPNPGWCPYGTRNSGQLYDQVYIQVNYEKEMTLFGVVTQGSHTNPKEWMTSYQVKYANESGQNFTTVMDSCNGCDNKIPRVFDGNVDRTTPKTNRFEQPITARIFRIYPIAWHNYPTMRFDFLTC